MIKKLGTYSIRFMFTAYCIKCTHIALELTGISMGYRYVLPPAKSLAVAQETLGVWCSLASRLGVWGVKSELEDLCFAVIQV